MFQFGEPEEIAQVYFDIAKVDPKFGRVAPEPSLDEWKVQMTLARSAYKTAVAGGATDEVLEIVKQVYDVAFLRISMKSDVLMDLMRAGKHKYLKIGPDVEVFYQTIFAQALMITGRASKYTDELNVQQVT